MAHNHQHRLRTLTFNETFQSSLQGPNRQKFVIDKSLARGIKENDVIKIIGGGEDGGMEGEREIFDDGEQLHQLTIATRMKYDRIKTQTANIQQSAHRLQNEKQILQASQQKYSASIHKKQLDMIYAEQKQAEVSAIMQSALHRKDTYSLMRATLKKDIITLKKRCFERDVQLMRDRNRLKALQAEHHNKVVLAQRCSKLAKSLQKTVNEKNKQRSARIHQLHQILARKKTHHTNRQIRSNTMQELMISAMYDKTGGEKDMVRMFHAQLFLKKLLRGKMENLMAKCKGIEMAYHSIRQSTSIDGVDDFIERYLAREQTYGGLLQSISQKQHQLQHLKKQRQELQKLYQKNLSTKQQIEEQQANTSPKNAKNLPTESHNEQLNERVIKINRQREMIYGWGIRFLAGYHGHVDRSQVAKKYNKLQVRELFLDILHVLKNYLKNIDDHQQNTSHKSDDAFMTGTIGQKYSMADSHLQKNTRIKTISTNQHDPTGRYPFEDTFQDQDLAYDDLSEFDYLQHSRRAIKKTNLQTRRFRIKSKPY